MANEEVETPSRRRFFEEDPEPGATLPAAFGEPRAMTAASEVLDLSKAARSASGKARASSAWQKSAWQYVDQIGELKFAFNLVSQIVSRAVLYPAVAENNSDIPVDTKVYLKNLEPEHGHNVTEACRIAQETLDELTTKGSGAAELLRVLALNLSIAGECYLINDAGSLGVASISEFELTNNGPTLSRSKMVTTGKKSLPSNTYAARIWRAHPQYADDPDSSMLGILDQCEKVVLFDQVIRAVSRSRLTAGAVTIPNGLVTVDGTPLPEAISKITVEPVEHEASTGTVTPLVLTGPPDLLDKVGRVELGRKLDSDFLMAYETALDRMFAGLDIPKNVVTGLADVKFANALVIDDSLYKAHIEPLLMLMCDALTRAYLRPVMLKNGVDEKLVDRFTIWYNPSQIVTRPDRSQAASEGYASHLLSGAAWRAARGFSEADKPTEEELLHRIALEKTQVPQEMQGMLIESIHPEFFDKERRAAQAEAGVPDELSNILNAEETGQTEFGPMPEDEAATQEQGAPIKPNGIVPPSDLDLQAEGII